MIKLSVRLSDGSEHHFSVQKQVAVVGRGSNCDVVLIADGVSREHLKIEASRTGVCYLTDLGSTNGTILDGKRIKPNSAVAYGPFQTVSIGSVPALTIETGVSAEKTLSAYRQAVRKKEDRTLEIEIDIPVEKVRTRRRPPPAEEIDTTPERKSVVTVALAVVAIIGVSYYFFLR